MVKGLQKQVVSLQQAARAKHRRCDNVQVRTTDKDGVPLAPEEVARLQQQADIRREEAAAKFFKEELKRRKLCRASIVKRLGLWLTPAERKQLRGMGFLGQEWFLAKRECAETLQKLLYTVEISLEMRLRENVSIRALRRMRRVLTE
eukprot:6177203-Prymnesium_polylepis.1